MTRLSGVLTAALILAAAGVAQAAETTGRIVAVDSKKIVLSNGKAFNLDRGALSRGLKPGDEVKVTYDDRGGQPIATGVAPTKK